MIQLVDLFATETEPQHDHGCKRVIRIPSDWTVEAEFGGPSDCFRYKLLHRWGPGPTAMIAMKNPSAAALRVGDSTVMKTARLFKRLGYGGQWIGNACAHRHVSPKALLLTTDPAGQRNLDAIAEMAGAADLLVVAHGVLPPGLQHHADAMVAVLRRSGKPLHVLRLTKKTGVPEHPLFLPDSTDPVLWSPE